MSNVTLMHKPRVELDANGAPVRAWIPSISTPGKTYEFERSVRGVWMHVTSDCEGWVRYQHCYHLEALMTEPTTAVAIASPLDLIEGFDDALIIQKLGKADELAVQTWCYSFPQDGTTVTGLSIDGVEEASREMARRGEPIDETWVRLDRETDKDAYFIAKATRYAVSPDGTRVEMDSAIRAKRQPKVGRRSNNGATYEIAAWYEIGVAKAIRNAKEALLPESIKQWMIETSKAQGHTRPANGRPRPEPTRVAPGANGPIGPAVAIARNEIARELSRLDSSTDHEYAAKVRAELASKFPEAFPNEGRRYIVGKMPEDKADAVLAWLRRQIDGDAPADEGEQGSFE